MDRCAHLPNVVTLNLSLFSAFTIARLLNRSLSGGRDWLVRAAEAGAVALKVPVVSHGTRWAVPRA